MNRIDTLGLPNGNIISIGKRIKFLTREGEVKEGDCLLIRPDDTLVVGISKNNGWPNDDGTKYYSVWYENIPVNNVLFDD